MMTEGDEKKNELAIAEEPIGGNPSNITIIYHQKQKIKLFEERLKQLTALLVESEAQHKRKKTPPQMEAAASSLNHSEYLKNALLQYFDAKISVQELLAVVSVGLNLDEKERKKAKQGKLMTEQTAKSKSWWG